MESARTEIEVQKEKVYKLREETCVGIIDCKNALQRNDWDYDKALDWLIHNYKPHRSYINIFEVNENDD